MKTTALSLLSCLLAACTPISATTPVSLSPTPQIEVTRIVAPPQGSPTPTPMCTELPEGMTFAITPLDTTRARVEVNGLQPGEVITLTFDQQAPSGSKRHEVFDIHVPADGHFETEERLDPAVGATRKHWQVQLIHARGVACAEVTLSDAATFPPDVYPSPAPPQQAIAFDDRQLCPSADGLEAKEALPLESAIEAVTAYFSGNTASARGASDPAHWALIPDLTLPAEQLQPDWFEAPQPASASPYATLVKTLCGQETLDRSWWVVYCAAQCAQPNRSASLANDFFFLHRKGHWLVWFMYP